MTAARCQHVTSRDGTSIGYWTSGDGPPLVLVHGALADHTRWDTLRPYLERHTTVHAMDRRGRGASTDGPTWTPERECEDVAAVIDAVAATAGAAVDVLGNSFGGFCAFGAATRTANIGKLVLYEGWPPVDPEAFRIPPELEKQLEVLLATGDREAALELAYREVLRVSEEDLDARRTHPAWSHRISAAHTIPREGRGFCETVFDAREAVRITVPTLLLVGSESPVWRAHVTTVADALPDARITVLDGHGHHADLHAPLEFAETVLGFLRSS
jgi:pimeloyl-ACP methyl ester carboxylesterase